MNQPLQIVECPRDAMQGLHNIIPTQTKIEYLNQLLKVGFHTLDFGSFVSPKAIPQLADTAEVLANLDLTATQTELLCIVANERGATEALTHPEIRYIGYPFSISQTFQLRNTNKTVEESKELVLRMRDLVAEAGDRELVVYLSMAFGNPYGDDWQPETTLGFGEWLQSEGVSIVSLADTVGTANPQDVEHLFQTLIQQFPQTVWGAHFHANPARWREKVAAAWQAGCRRFDGAIKGYGGCPFAKDELVGNIATENLIEFIESQSPDFRLDRNAFAQSLNQANAVFLS